MSDRYDLWGALSSINLQQLRGVIRDTLTLLSPLPFCPLDCHRLPVEAEARMHVLKMHRRSLDYQLIAGLDTEYSRGR